MYEGPTLNEEDFSRKIPATLRDFGLEIEITLTPSLSYQAYEDGTQHCVITRVLCYVVNKSQVAVPTQVSVPYVGVLPLIAIQKLGQKLVMKFRKKSQTLGK